MTKQPDGAFLFWARDWLTDEAVVLMSPAAKGVYIDLLCHCWLEGSVPACSMQCARIARIDADAFGELWAELAPLFVPHASEDGRLVNKRMEEERGKQEERRKSRSAKAAAAAEARWGKDRKKSKRSATGNARSNANASTQAMLGDAHQTKPSTTPLTPQGEGPTPDGEGAAAARPAEAPPAAARPERQRASGDDATPVADVTSALMGTRYRAGVTNAIARRGVIGSEAKRLVETGIRPEHVRELAQLAAEKSSKDPGALLAHWLDGNAWRSVLDEEAGKLKEHGLRGRQAPAEDDPVTEPKTAASVLDDVLPKQAEGA